MISLYIATPMHDGTAHGIFIKSMMKLQELAIKRGIGLHFGFIYKDALVARARNYLVDDFLRSNCTHLVFIDSDIGFDAANVLEMIDLNLDVVSAPFPKKIINWDNVKTAIKSNPAINSGDLEKLTGDFAYNPVGQKTIDLRQPIEVKEVGTGLVMIKRSVFERVRSAYPELKFKTDQKSMAHIKEVQCFFDTVIDKKTRRYMSEGFFFCDLWTAIGGKIHVCQWMNVSHAGLHVFKGDVAEISKYCSTL